MKTEIFVTEELVKIHAALHPEYPDEYRYEYPEIDLYQLLSYIHCENIFYFKSKYDNFSFLGLGFSTTIKAQDINEYLKQHPEHYLVASFLFEQDPALTEFILPEWSFVTKKGITYLTINKSFEYKTFSIPHLFFDPTLEANDSPLIPPWQSYNESPEHDQWNRLINICDNLFDKNELEKIVLSRKKIFDYLYPIAPIDFFKAAMVKNNHAESSYAIFHQINFKESFISLSPEKLFSLKKLSSGNLFESISLAASAPRGSNDREDKKLEDFLTYSDKLIREHEIVTTEMIRKIKPLAETISLSPLQTMKLPYIQHRFATIQAKLLNDITALTLVQNLHPTPAIGGLPWESAKQKIIELEKTPRKHYAAPIGVISAYHTELAVGIRSAEISESTITLFGGAGIVKGSMAEEEWIETGTKMNPFLKVINNE